MLSMSRELEVGPASPPGDRTRLATSPDSGVLLAAVVGFLLLGVFAVLAALLPLLRA